jgi:hypothetical protein
MPEYEATQKGDGGEAFEGVLMGELYYRGISKGRKPIGYKTGIYFTRHPEEAKFYAGRKGKIIQARIEPKKPLHTETFPDSAKKLGLWDKHFEHLLMTDPAKAHAVVASVAERRDTTQ